MKYTVIATLGTEKITERDVLGTELASVRRDFERQGYSVEVVPQD